jgi:hypothetical protein
MKPRALLLLALIASDPIGCQRTGSRPESDPVAVTTQETHEPHFVDVLPERVAAVLRKPTSVRFFRIVNSFDVSPPEYAALRSEKTRIAGYPVIAEVQGTSGQARAIGEVLLRKESYLKPGQAWMCIFEPHHIAQITNGSESVNVIICFKCGDVELRLPDDRTPGEQNQGLSQEGEARLYEIVGKRFPDPELTH